MALLRDDFWPAIFHADTGCTSIDDPHNIASRSARIASCFLELEKMNQELESKLRSDFHSILNSMDGLSLSPTSHPEPPLPTPRMGATSAPSSFTIAGYSWLLENIANPYPPPTVKASFAQQHSYSLSAVNSWFINARRRMGWTTLCRDHFNNCRADALDAAHRALVNEDPNRPLRPDITHAFVCVKAAAEGLYSSASAKNAFPGDLDAIVGGMPDQGAAAVDGRKHRGPDEVVESPGISEAELQSDTQYCYPSSDYSSFSSPVPPLDESLTDDSEEEEDISPPVLAGRKRRLSYSQPTQEPTLCTKRRRHMRSSIEICVSPSAEGSRSNSGPQSSKNVSSLPRGCHLSGTEATRISKSPLELTTGPRLHTISGPLLPLESDHTIDEWFKHNFDHLFAFPPPVDVVEPDLSAQLEFEVFSNYNLPQAPERQLSKLLNLPLESQASGPGDLFALDDFLQSLENFTAPSGTANSIITVPTTHSIPQPQNLSLSGSIDWAALLDADGCEPAFGFVPDQVHPYSWPPPEIGLSVLQLP